MVSYKAGDHVQYHAVGGSSQGTASSTTTGKIVDIITEDDSAGNSGVRVHASSNEPRYLIRNDNTQKETAYKADNILKKI